VKVYLKKEKAERALLEKSKEFLFQLLEDASHHWSLLGLRGPDEDSPLSETCVEMLREHGMDIEDRWPHDQDAEILATLKKMSEGQVHRFIDRLTTFYYEITETELDLDTLGADS
jgi:hypothetical protein